MWCRTKTHLIHPYLKLLLELAIPGVCAGRGLFFREAVKLPKGPKLLRSGALCGWQGANNAGVAALAFGFVERLIGVGQERVDIHVRGDKPHCAQADGTLLTAVFRGKSLRRNQRGKPFLH